MSMIPVAAFGADGVPVYVVREWAPGVEFVREVPPGYGAPYYTPILEYGPGVKVVMLDGDGKLSQDRARQLMDQQANAFAAQQALAAPPVVHAASADPSSFTQLRLLG